MIEYDFSLSLSLFVSLLYIRKAGKERGPGLLKE